MGDYRNENELTIDDVHSVTLKLVEKLIRKRSISTRQA